MEKVKQLEKDIEAKVNQKLKRKVYLYEILLSSLLSIAIIKDLWFYATEQTMPEFMDSKNINQFLMFIIFFTLKYKTEGLRTNTLFLILGYIFFFFQKYHLSSTILVISAIFSGIYSASLIIMPCYHFPTPRGKYNVGYKEHIFQNSKKNIELLNEWSIFYPTLENNYTDSKVKWACYKHFARDIVQFLNSDTLERVLPFKLPVFIGKFISSYLEKINLRVIQNAKIAKPQDNKKIELICFSHGLSAHRNAYSTYFTELASQGYIVVSIQHHENITLPHESTNYSQEKKIRLLQQDRHKHIINRQLQVENVIDFFEDNEQIQKLFQTKLDIDLQNLTVMGHSFGGGTSIYSAMKDQRVKKILCLDPWMFPIDESEIEQLNVKIPMLMINTSTFYQICSHQKLKQLNTKFMKINEKYQDNKIALQFKGTAHSNQIDLAFTQPFDLVQFKQLVSQNHILEYQKMDIQYILLFLKYFKNSNPEKNKKNKKTIKQNFQEFAESIKMENFIEYEFEEYN